MMRPETRSGRPASQRADELGPFIDLLKAEGVHRYLEIGARHGDTFFDVMTALGAGAFGVAVDLPGGAWGTVSSRGALNNAVADLRSAGRRAHAVFGDSTSPEVLAAVAELNIGHGVFDAVLIDGDHRYAGVSKDWSIWGRFARLVAFHDIAGEGVVAKSGPVEVPRLWAELKAKHRHVEFIGAERGMGIGVLWP